MKELRQGLKEKDIPESLKGEAAMIECLEELVKQSHAKMPGDKSLSGALADLLTLDCILSQSLGDSIHDSPHYPSAQKQKDLKFLSWFLVGRYIHSLQSFSMIEQKTVSKLMQLYSAIDTKEVKECVHSCVDFLYESMR